MTLIRCIQLLRTFNQSRHLVVSKPSCLNLAQLKRSFSTSLMFKSAETPHQSSEGEKKLIDLLKKRFPDAAIEVIDISGGCGAMYTVYVETKEFTNLRTVKQHQLVNDCLRTEIKNNMHGIRIQTAVPKQ